MKMVALELLRLQARWLDQVKEAQWSLLMKMINCKHEIQLNIIK